MKRIICLLLFAAYGLLANPVDPGFRFSELQFDEQNNWQLEIHSLWYDIINVMDSVLISTGSQKSKILSNVFSNTSSYYYKIQNTPQCLSKPLSVNTEKDTIRITTYWHYKNISTFCLAFGAGTDYPVNPQEMSIANFFYSVDGGQGHSLGIGYNPTPSFGAANDSTGVFGILQGKICDKNGLPLANKRFYISGMWPSYFWTDSSGNYRQRVLAKHVYLNSIQDYYFTNCNLVTPVEVLIMPGYTYYRDFILDMVSINEQPTSVKSSALLYNYPNPFNNQTAIYYEVPEGVKYKNAAIRISNIKGEAVAVLAANQKSGSVYWNADHNSAGMYIYQLLIDGKAVKSGEMVLLK